MTRPDTSGKALDRKKRRRRRAAGQGAQRRRQKPRRESTLAIIDRLLLSPVQTSLNGKVTRITVLEAIINGSFLNDVIDHYAIRTIINLRGRNPDTNWYRDETAIATRRGITHIDIGMSASKEPDAATIERLIEAFKKAPRPILVHCEAGADRSGLASALYELLIAHRPASEAERQLSFYYGHFPWLTSKTGAMDNAFERIATGVH